MIKWTAAEMHCHTLHSDGKFTVDELLQTAHDYQLEMIALTDHNTLSGHRELSPEKEDKTVKVIRGIEWTTFFGHMLVLGCPEYVDWRYALPDTIDESIQKIRALGGIVGVAHPYELGSPICTGGCWEYHVHKWENVSYIEVWSEEFPSIKTANHRSVAMWNGLLDKGYHLAATHGKDWHGAVIENVPSGCTYLGIAGDCTPENGKEAVKCGRTVVTMGPLFTMQVQKSGKTYEIGETAESGEAEFKFFTDMRAREEMWARFAFAPAEIRLIGNGGEVLEKIPYSAELLLPFILTRGWYRAELWGNAMGKNCCLAMTSPIYVK